MVKPDRLVISLLAPEAAAAARLVRAPAAVVAPVPPLATGTLLVTPTVTRCRCQDTAAWASWGERIARCYSQVAATVTVVAPASWVSNELAIVLEPVNMAIVLAVASGAGTDAAKARTAAPAWCRASGGYQALTGRASASSTDCAGAVAITAHRLGLAWWRRYHMARPP